ncbi:hypothetical protein HK102_003066, partial [Quaeritorhiza haematococci]
MRSIQTCMAGFSFADENEAATFYDKVMSKDSLPPTTPAGITVAPAPVAPPTPAVATIVKSPSEEKEKKSKKEKPEKESSSFFGFGKKSKSSKGKQKKGKIDKSMIGDPTGFTHVSHVGFNPKTGFSAQNIPVEWKAIFAKAGITE